MRGEWAVQSTRMCRSYACQRETAVGRDGSMTPISETRLADREAPPGSMNNKTTTNTYYITEKNTWKTKKRRKVMGKDLVCSTSIRKEDRAIVENVKTSVRAA